MANCLNRCASILSATGMSSCTEYLSHPCQRRGNNECCQCSCYFINDHTYSILKKICRKMIQDYNRSKCNENYKIFDGGNSINVRIHRSSRQARTFRMGNTLTEDQCATHPSIFQITNQREKSRRQQDTRGINSRQDRNSEKFSSYNFQSDSRKSSGKYGKNRHNRDSWEFSSENFESDRRIGSGEFEKSNGIADVFNPHKKDYKARKRERRAKSFERRDKYSTDDQDNDERRFNEKVKVGKRGSANNDNYYMKKPDQKLKEKGAKVDDDYSDVEIQERTRKRGKRHNKSREEDDYNETKKAKTNKRRSKYSNDDDAKDKQNKRKTQNLKSEDGDYVQNNKKGKGKRGDENHKKKTRGEKPDNNSNSSDNDMHGTRIQRNKEKQTEYDTRIITDLGKNVRKDNQFGSKSGHPSITAHSLQRQGGKQNGKIIRLSKQDAKTLQYKPLKTTRVDEAKTCDHLRANMENRELCNSNCFPPKSCPCNDYQCVACPWMLCICSDFSYPCNPESSSKC